MFAVPHICHVPGCCIMSDIGCICGGCNAVWYCEKGCQKAHWKQHRPVCKMLQAAVYDVQPVGTAKAIFGRISWLLWRR